MNELAQLPISNTLYGTDHPSKRPAIKIQKSVEHSSAIAELIPMRILGKLVKNPRELLTHIRVERREKERNA